MLALIILILTTIHKGDIRIENSTENIFILFLASVWYIFLCQRSMSSAKKNSKIFTRWLELKVSMVISKALEHITSQNIMFFESAKLYIRATNFYYYYHLFSTFTVLLPVFLLSFIMNHATIKSNKRRNSDRIEYTEQLGSSFNIFFFFLSVRQQSRWTTQRKFFFVMQHIVNLFGCTRSQLRHANSLLRRVGSSSPPRDWTWAACLGSTGS